MEVKQFNYVVERELVLYGVIDFEFFKQAKFFFVEN